MSLPTVRPTISVAIYCNSVTDTPCRRRSDPLNQAVAGYKCVDSVCYKCPTGYFGTDGKTCRSCGLYQSSAEGSGECSDVISQVVPGLHSLFIPPGIKKINVRLWGGGGAGDQCGAIAADGFTPSGGGGGGFSKCDMSVTPNSTIFMLVAGGAIGTIQITDYVDPGGEWLTLDEFSFFFKTQQRVAHIHALRR